MMRKTRSYRTQGSRRGMGMRGKRRTIGACCSPAFVAVGANWWIEAVWSLSRDGMAPSYCLFGHVLCADAISS